MKNSAHRLPRLIQLRAHAAAGIENNSDRERRVLAAERYDFLLQFVLENLERFLFEARHKPVQRIGYGDRNQHHVRIDPDIGAGQRRRRFAGFGARRNFRGIFRITNHA